MSYRVLARKYRSRTFEEVVGQEHIATTLANAIKADRIHHGYLFTGTRGVGKTTMARILSKSLNCLSADGPTVTPCCKCDACTGIGEGEDVDVIEMDAASNRGIDTIRDLRANVTLRPARSRFKIYIVDEVHMLTMEAFNALLKTLEEPPPHVKFILATTELQKVPATIVSRCQQFDFRAIDAETIWRQLTRICENEEIRADEEVLRRVARLGNGSMRDALSILDMLLSYESEHLTMSVAEEVIPPPHDELAAAIMERVAEGDTSGALSALDQALSSGRTPERVCDQLLNHARTLMVILVCGAETGLVDVPAGLRKRLAEEARRFDAPTYVYIISLLEELRRNVKYSGAGRALADAAMVRLSMARQFSDIRPWLDRLAGDGKQKSAEAPVAAIKKNVAVSAASRRGSSAPLAKPAASAARPERTGAVAPKAGGSAEAPVGLFGSATQRPATISSQQRQQVLSDPLVQRVKEAVDGTLIDIRPAPSDKRTAVEETAGVAEPEIEPLTNE